MAITHSESPTTSTTRSNSSSRSSSFDTSSRSCSCRSAMNGNSDCLHTIHASDQVSQADILENLKLAKQDPTILKLHIQDFVTSKHLQALLPVVKALFTCDERDWKRIRFKETQLKATQFPSWQKLKTKLMRDCEDTLPDHLLEFLTLEAHLLVPDQDALMPLFHTLPRDEDIVDMRFKGPLEGVDKEHIPEELEHFLHTNNTDEPVVIHLVCGWQDEEAEENTNLHDLCDACKTFIEHAQSVMDDDHCEELAPPPPPALNRGKSAPLRMPSRRMHRGVSRDDVEEAQQQKLDLIDDDDDDEQPENNNNSNMDASNSNRVPRLPSRGARRGPPPPAGAAPGGALTRRAPERTKSLGVLPSRTASAADRLALLGAGGSKRVASRRVPERTNSRSIPERSASGRRTPTRTSSRKVHDAGTQGRSLPARSNSRKVTSRQEEE